MIPAVAVPGSERRWFERIPGRVERWVTSMVEQLDRWQQSRRVPGLLFAVVLKYRSDGGGRWATLLAHYGFVSLFPFVFLLVTLLGSALPGDPAWQHRILHSALAGLPISGPRASVASVHESASATLVGLLLAIYGGGAVLRTAHAALDVVWATPAGSVGAYVRTHLRVAASGAVLLVVTIAAAVAGGLTTSASSLPGETRLLSLAISTLLSTGVFLFVFRTLTEARATWRSVAPGALTGALGWTLLHLIGGIYIQHVVRQASPTYGTFAVVIGILAWLYLQARLLLLAAELNVVLAKGLWPLALRDDRPMRNRT